VKKDAGTGLTGGSNEQGTPAAIQIPRFDCDFRQVRKAFPHFWEHTVGSGHAPLALRADWQTQMRRCHQELGFEYVRFHALLSDEMGTLLCEENQLLYLFFNADQIVDFLLSIGMKPFVELSFMPETLASGTTTVFSYRANVTPPKDYDQWAVLIQKLAEHWVSRYGAAEVRTWFFEVWNEPNLEAFWTGGQDGYFQLYRRTAVAIKSVDASIKVGGPATADNKWIPEFLGFCRTNAVPVDFISTHHYPTDAFGKPGADTVTQLQHSPRGMMKNQASIARQEAGSLPLYYTEWNISSNPRDPMHDEPFAAAFATKIVMDAHGLVQGYSYWTFSDIFSENYFPSVPFQGGFGLLNIHGIAKPIYRAFQLLHALGKELLEVAGRHSTVDVWVVSKEKSATVLITNLAMPRHPIQTELVHLRLVGAPVPKIAWIERIDEDHANPRALWHAMGEPEYLSARQVAHLCEASALRQDPQPWTREQENLELHVSLPAQSIAAITIEFD
jgi:xylan 1,4-beta-xylosidase